MKVCAATFVVSGNRSTESESEPESEPEPKPAVAPATVSGSVLRLPLTIICLHPAMRLRGAQGRAGMDGSLGNAQSCRLRTASTMRVISSGVRSGRTGREMTSLAAASVTGNTSLNPIST